MPFLRSFNHNRAGNVSYHLAGWSVDGFVRVTFFWPIRLESYAYFILQSVEEAGRGDRRPERPERPAENMPPAPADLIKQVRSHLFDASSHFFSRI